MAEGRDAGDAAQVVQYVGGRELQVAGRGQRGAVVGRGQRVVVVGRSRGSEAEAEGRAQRFQPTTARESTGPTAEVGGTRESTGPSHGGS